MYMYLPQKEHIKEAKKISEKDAFVLMEDDECSKIYFRTDKLVFTVSSLLPGQRTPMDSGHSGADEVVYCIEGNLVIHLPDEKRYVELTGGDALCIPENKKHMAINVGDTIAKSVWSLAPGMGKPEME